jgi:hypothetical protein
MTDDFESPFQDRAMAALEAIRRTRLEIAKSRAQKINTYLLRMELRDCRRRLRAEIVKAKALALPPAA